MVSLALVVSVNVFTSDWALGWKVRDAGAVPAGSCSALNSGALSASVAMTPGLCLSFYQYLGLFEWRYHAYAMDCLWTISGNSAAELALLAH